MDSNSMIDPENETFAQINQKCHFCREIQD